MADQDKKPKETFFKRILDATPKETLKKVVRNESRRGTIFRVLSEQVRYYEMFEDESDRGAAVLAHALFDDRLGKVLRSCNGALKGAGYSSGSKSKSPIPSDSSIKRLEMVYVSYIRSATNSPTQSKR